MTELARKIDVALDRIETFQRPEGLYLAFSGGKDSIVCKRLLDMASVKYDAHYRVTSVDPPELVRYIRDQHPDVSRDIPRYDDGSPITMWNLIPRKLIPPTRLIRYCCESLKENAGEGRLTVTGVRWAESRNRKDNHGVVTVMDRGAKQELGNSEDFLPTRQGGLMLMNDNDSSRRMVESCYKKHKTTLNPIIDWTDAEVWQFIRSEKIPYCSLYDEGFRRLGCIGCPLASRKSRAEEFRRWPKYRDAYLHAFEKMLCERERKGKVDGEWRMGTDPNEVMHWWMEDGVLPGQYMIENY